MDDSVGRVIERTIEYWLGLDADWQGVVLGVAIVALIGLFGIDIPW